MDEGFLSIKDAAAEFGLPRQRIYRWIKAGKLSYYLWGRDLRFKLVRREDIAQLLQPRREAPVDVIKESPDAQRS